MVLSSSPLKSIIQLNGSTIHIFGVVHSHIDNIKFLEGITRDSRLYQHFCVELCSSRLGFMKKEIEFQRTHKKNEFVFLARNIPHSKLVPIDLSLYDQGYIYEKLISSSNEIKSNSGLSYMEIHNLITNIMNPNLLKYKQIALSRFPQFKYVFIDLRETYMAIQIYQTLLKCPNSSSIVCVIGAFHFQRVNSIIQSIKQTRDLTQFNFNDKQYQ